MLEDCSLCPRNCHVNRNITKGYCGQSNDLRAARAGLHFYEEPFLSGPFSAEDKNRGSGTVFFSGCNLGCIYCQNSDITGDDAFGVVTDTDRLSQVFLELQDKGAYNINLVTGTPYIPYIADALSKVRSNGSLRIPVIWNSSGYENIPALEMLRGLVDIWLPDLKTLSSDLASRYMNAPDYPEKAMEALDWMVANTGPARFIPADGATMSEDSDISECSLMTEGVCVRHLVIPTQAEDSMKVLEYLFKRYGNRIWISLMSQYTPIRQDFPYPELNGKLRRKEYDRVVDFAIGLGIEQCMIQGGDVADDSFIPIFDGTGII